MTVPSEQSKSGPYNGNGVTTIFDYDFKINDEAHIQVVKNVAGAETVLTIDTDYIVADVGEPGGGSVAMVVAPASGSTITLIRNVPFTQETDLENQGAYYAEVVERAFDEGAMRDQQLAEVLARSLKGRISDGKFDALGEQIGNAADGTEPGDLATIGQIQDVSGAAGAAAGATAGAAAGTTAAEAVVAGKADVDLANAQGALVFTRSAITSRTVPFQRFSVSGSYATNDDGAGATYIRSNPQVGTGPMAIQDAANVWYELELPGRIEPRWFRLTADGANWGLAFQRAIDAVKTRGWGSIYARSGTYTFSSQFQIKKSGCFISVIGDGPTTIFKCATGFTNHMIRLGETPNVGGGAQVSFDGIAFLGDSISASKALKLDYANAATFSRCHFTNFLLPADSVDSYAVVFDNECMFLNIGYSIFYSSTAAHGFRLLNCKLYNIGKIAGVNSGGAVTIDGASFNIVIRDNDIEVFTYALKMAGGYNLIFNGNYTEQHADYPIIATATIYGASIKGNLFSEGISWPLTNFEDGEFAFNSINSTPAMAITFPGAVDMDVHNNTKFGAATIGAPLWQAATLTAGWTAQGYEPVSYRKVHGEVQLRGNFVATAVPGTAFTLPTKYRPATPVALIGCGTSNYCRYYVQTNGTVVIQTAASNECGISGGRFTN